MSSRRRVDGTLLRDIPALKVINPYVMRGRNESIVFYAHELDLTATLLFIRNFNRTALAKDQPHLTPFHILLCAMVRTLALRPQLNRFIQGHRLYQRNKLQISFIVKKELTDEGLEANAKITFSPFETLASIIPKLSLEVKHARRGAGTEADKEVEAFAKLPRFVLRWVVKAFRWLDYHGIAPRSMIESDPLFTSIYVANLSALGLEAPFHHLYEWGNASLFVALGRLRRKAVLLPDGTIAKRDLMPCNVSFDDRVSEGIYAAKALELFKNFVENPQLLIEPPLYSQQDLEALMLDPGSYSAS